MPETVRAVVVDPSSPEGLAVKPVEMAPAGSDEVTVRVTAISLNRGEVRRATSQGKPGDRRMVRRTRWRRRRPQAAAPHGPVHLILDSVGGATLAAALTMLAPGGTCVTFGVSESATSTIASAEFFRAGGVKLYGLMLFH